MAGRSKLLDLRNFPCGKYIESSAMSNVWKSFQEKARTTGHLQKKAFFIFYFFIEELNISDVFYKIKIETNDQFFQYSHYCLESLKLSALVSKLQER